MPDRQPVTINLPVLPPGVWHKVEVYVKVTPDDEFGKSVLLDELQATPVADDDPPSDEIADDTLDPDNSPVAYWRLSDVPGEADDA